MVKKDKGPTDPNVASLIVELRKASKNNEAPIWRSISKKLQKSRRTRPQVNVSKLNRFTENDEFVVIPGKVLGSGELNHSVNVAAVTFSEGARNKILAAEGRVLTISELINEKPKGSGVKILG
ncbi:MAG: 50S ribosomal protein L18e [Candidatus Heimdallarchaeota archaeon LC_2]|nr:MAG: 50S ribosomal protein L18e [Candidatus Heimdallarchaeota archaeon LC_2]